MAKSNQPKKWSQMESADPAVWAESWAGTSKVL